MVTIRNDAVVGALMALRKLDNVKLSAVTSLKLVKLNKALSAHWEDVDKVREQVVKDGAKLDANGEPVKGKEPGSIELDPAKKAEVEASITALFEKTFDVEDKLVLKVSDFEGVQIEPAIFLGLGDLITE